jgi:hypothetical protein
MTGNNVDLCGSCLIGLNLSLLQDRNSLLRALGNFHLGTAEILGFSASRGALGPGCAIDSL